MNPVLMEKDGLIQAMMDKDPQRRFIQPADVRSWGKYAWDKGHKTAEYTMAEYPELSPEEIARTMGLSVADMEGPGFHFSEYDVKKRSIVLFSNTIESEFIELEASYLKTTEYQAVRQLFLAHELFHHLECSDPDVGITYRERQVTVFSVGPFKWKTGLRCLSEIAAHSFALRLAGGAVVA